MFTAIATLLASATFIVCVTIALVVLMTILLEYGKEGWTTTLFSVGIALWLWNFGGVIWAYASVNPTATLGFVVSYVVAGIIWSVLKWSSSVKEVFNEAKKIKDKFNLPDDVKTDDNIWKEFIEN